MSVTIKLSGKSRVMAACRKETAKRLNVAAEYLRSKIAERISTSTRAAGPSAPGEPPHADTGKLRQSLQVRRAGPADLRALVGSPLDYALFLELGTPHMAARPFLRSTLYIERQAIRRILTHG